MAECIVKVPRDTVADYDYIAFSFNGYHSYEDLKILRVSDGDRYEENIAPKIKAKTEKASGTEGDYLFEITHKRKTFSINIAFDDLYEEDYQKLKQVFRPDIMGELWFAEYPFKVYDAKLAAPLTLNVIPFDAPDGSGRRLYKGTGTIEMFAPYPYAHTPDKVVCWDEEREIYVERGDGKNLASYVDFNNKEQWKSIFEMHGEVPSYFQIKIGTKENSQLKYGLSEDGTYAICLGPRDYDTNPFVYWDSEAETWKTDNDITKINAHDWKLRIPDTIFLYGKELEVKEIADYAFLENANKFVTRIKQNVDIYLPSTVEKIGYKTFYFQYHGKILFEGECNVKYFERQSVYYTSHLQTLTEGTNQWNYFGPEDKKRIIYAYPPYFGEIVLPTGVSVIGKNAFNLSNKEVTDVNLYNSNDELYFNLPIFDSNFLKQFQNGTLRLPFIGRSKQEPAQLANFFDGDKYSIKTLYVHSGKIVPRCFEDINFSEEPSILLRKNNFNIITKEAFKNAKFTSVGTFEEYDEGNILYVSKIESGAFVNSKINGLVLKPTDETEKTLIIESGAFVSCQYLQSLSLDGFNKISANGAFGDKNHVKELNINYPTENWTKLKDMMGQPSAQQTLTIKGTVPKEFARQYAIFKLDISSSTQIREKAFYSCQNLNTIIMPVNNRTSPHFYNNAFENCGASIEAVITKDLDQWLLYQFDNEKSNPIANMSMPKISTINAASNKEDLEITSFEDKVIYKYAFPRYSFSKEVNFTGAYVYKNAFYRSNFSKLVSLTIADKQHIKEESFCSTTFYGGLHLIIKNIEATYHCFAGSRVFANLSVDLSSLTSTNQYDEFSISYLFKDSPFSGIENYIDIVLPDRTYLPPSLFANLGRDSVVYPSIYCQDYTTIFHNAKNYHELFKETNARSFEIYTFNEQDKSYQQLQYSFKAEKYICCYQGGYKSLTKEAGLKISNMSLPNQQELIFDLGNTLYPINGNWNILDASKIDLRNNTRIDLSNVADNILIKQGKKLEGKDLICPKGTCFYRLVTGDDNNGYKPLNDSDAPSINFRTKANYYGYSCAIREYLQYYSIYGGKI